MIIHLFYFLSLFLSWYCRSLSSRVIVVPLEEESDVESPVEGVGELVGELAGELVGELVEDSIEEPV